MNHTIMYKNSWFYTDADWHPFRRMLLRETEEVAECCFLSNDVVELKEQVN